MTDPIYRDKNMIVKKIYCGTKLGWLLQITPPKSANDSYIKLDDKQCKELAEILCDYLKSKGILTPSIYEAFKQGLRDGVTRYAWWKDGTQYVGTCKTTLKEALEDIK